VTNVGKSGNDANPTYRLSAAGREAAEDERLRLLETIFDPDSWVALVTCKSSR